MNNYPFNAPFADHCSSLRKGMNLIAELARLHPQLRPWIVSPIVPSVSFPSTAADELKAAFGSEGWQTEGDRIFRVENGVRIEMRLPMQHSEPRPFVL